MLNKEQTTTIQLKNNTSLDITIFKAKVSNAPVLIIYPAFGVVAAYYQRFATQLSEKGITVVTVDLHGHGLSSVRPSKQNNYGFLEMLEDLKAVSDYLRQATPQSKVYILGHSLGGQTASLAVAKYPNKFAGLATIGSPNVYFKGWSGVHYYRRKILVGLLPIFGRIISFLPMVKIGGYYTTPKQIKEWGYTGKTGKFKVIGDNLDYEKAMKAVTIPVLAIDIEGDLMAPQKAIFNLYQKFKNTSALSTYTLTKVATSSKLSHINWPHRATNLMVQIIHDWVDKHK